MAILRDSAPAKKKYIHTPKKSKPKRTAKKKIKRNSKSKLK